MNTAKLHAALVRIKAEQKSIDRIFIANPLDFPKPYSPLSRDTYTYFVKNDSQFMRHRQTLLGRIALGAWLALPALPLSREDAKAMSEQGWKALALCHPTGIVYTPWYKCN